MSLSRSIKLISEGRYDEGFAKAAYLPGTLLELAADAAKSGVYSYPAHSTDGGSTSKTVAMEDALQGKTVDDVTVVGESGPIWHPKQGDDMQYLLLAGGTTPVVIGTKLCSNGAGRLIPVADSGLVPIIDADIVGEALEALDITGGATDTLIAVRVY